MPHDLYTGKKIFACPPTKDHSPRAKAKQVLGLQPETQHLLVCAPNCDAGFLSDVLSMIYVGDDYDSEISVVCGENAELLRRLEHDLGHIETIHLFGRSSDLPLLLDSADLLLAEPNEALANEAAGRRLPLVLLRNENRLLPEFCRELLAKGCAVAVREDVQLAELCIQLLADEKRRTQMANDYAAK